MKKHVVTSLAAVAAVAVGLFTLSTPAQAAAPRTLPAGDTIYLFGCTAGSTNPPGVGNLADDGTVTQVAPFPSAPDSNGHCFFGPAYDPTSGLVYVLDPRRDPLTMWVFDPATNSFAAGAANVSTCKPAQLAIDHNGVAYALTAYNAPNPNSLVTINLSTGECSAPIGDPFTTTLEADFAGFGGFAFNLTDNVLYATDYISGRFISINTSDATFTDFPNSSFAPQSSYGSIGFDSTGMTWIAYGDYAQSLQSAPFSSYTADYADQGYYDYNGSYLYADGLTVVPGGSAPTPTPDPTPLPDTGSSGSADVIAGAVALLLALAGTVGVVVARRRRGSSPSA